MAEEELDDLVSGFSGTEEHFLADRCVERTGLIWIGALAQQFFSLGKVIECQNIFLRGDQ